MSNFLFGFASCALVIIADRAARQIDWADVASSLARCWVALQNLSPQTVKQLNGASKKSLTQRIECCPHCEKCGRGWKVVDNAVGGTVQKCAGCSKFSVVAGRYTLRVWVTEQVREKPKAPVVLPVGGKPRFVQQYQLT